MSNQLISLKNIQEHQIRKILWILSQICGIHCSSWLWWATKSDERLRSARTGDTDWHWLLQFDLRSHNLKKIWVRVISSNPFPTQNVAILYKFLLILFFLLKKEISMTDWKIEYLKPLSTWILVETCFCGEIGFGIWLQNREGEKFEI